MLFLSIRIRHFLWTTTLLPLAIAQGAEIKPRPFAGAGTGARPPGLGAKPNPESSGRPPSEIGSAAESKDLDSATSSLGFRMPRIGDEKLNLSPLISLSRGGLGVKLKIQI